MEWFWVPDRLNPAVLRDRGGDGAQSTYCILVEMKQGQCTVSAQSAGAYTATLLVMVNIIRGGGRAPPTLTSQGPILPSSLNLRQKADVTTLCTLWEYQNGMEWMKKLVKYWPVKQTMSPSPPPPSGRVPQGHDKGNSADEQDTGGYSGDVADLPGQGGHPGQPDVGVRMLWFLALMKKQGLDVRGCP
jgi:hypothetical protein